MEKLVYLFESGDCQDKPAAAQKILAAASALAKQGPNVAVNVWESDPQVRALATHYATSNGNGQLLGVLSVWLDSLDNRTQIDSAIAALHLPWHSYLVTESVPREYARRNWPVGEKSPGVTLVAAFQKSARLSDATFFQRWQQGHTPLSLQVHPLSRYIRNAVARPLTPDAPRFSAIVEERVQQLDDLLPENFYGGQAQRVSEDLASFVDLSRPDQIRIELMSEYLFYP